MVRWETVKEEIVMFQAVCFDFDYTLGDCTDSIVAGFVHGLTGLGWPAPDRETVRGTVGYLLEDSYTMITGDCDPDRRARFRALFSEIAVERQRKETVLYRHKPDPEGLLYALDRLGVRPEDALFCGDTVLDAGAAKNAGTHFAAVLQGTTPREAFDSFPTDYIAPKLADLARWLEI